MKGYIMVDDRTGNWYNDDDNPYTAEELIGFANWLMNTYPDIFIGLPNPTVTIEQRITVCRRYDILVAEVITD